MKKRSIILNRTAVRIMVFPILCLIAVSSQADVSVREMMKNEVFDVSSLQMFYTSHNTPYQQRYFLKYLPHYLAKLEISGIPDWVFTALDAALDSDYTPLAIAAVKSIGDLKLESFSDKMTERFIASEQEAHHSLSYRIAVLEAFKKFDGSEKIKSNISQLLLHFPENRICDPDFTGLMEVTVRFGAEGNASLLTRFEARVDTMVGRQVTDERRNPDLDRIKELIQRTKRSLAVKGGHDE